MLIGYSSVFSKGIVYRLALLCMYTSILLLTLHVHVCCIFNAMINADVCTMLNRMLTVMLNTTCEVIINAVLNAMHNESSQCNDVQNIL